MSAVERPTAGEDSVFEISGLEVRYGRREILRGLDLRLEEGEAMALVGRNGAGKSSLVRCLLGQQKPTSGKVHLFGRDVWRHRAKLMGRLGVVPEEGDAPPSMTAGQLAGFCRPLYQAWDQSSFDERLERFSVPRKTAFGALSRGQKTQVMLALALAPRPDFLVLDDPTLGLDAVARRAVFEELVGELADRGTSLFFTSHDLPGIESVATRIAVLSDGELLLDEELESLKARYRWLTVDDDEDLSVLEPVAEHRLGRRRRVLVSRWGEAPMPASASRAEVEPASLEEIVVELPGGDAAP